MRYISTPQVPRAIASHRAHPRSRNNPTAAALCKTHTPKKTEASPARPIPQPKGARIGSFPNHSGIAAGKAKINIALAPRSTLGTAKMMNQAEINGSAEREQVPRVEATLLEADQIAHSGQPVVVEVDIDYDRKTFFTKDVVKANLHRLPLRDRVRFIGRAVKRKLTG